MTRHRIAQIGENRNPKSPENRTQARRFLQIRLLELRRSATPFNGLAVLHGRLSRLLSPECVPVEDQRLIHFAVMTGTMLPVGRTVRQYSKDLTAPRKSANSYG